MITTKRSAESVNSVQALDQALTAHRKSGVYRTVTLPAGLEQAAAKAMLAYHHVDASSAKTKAQMLRLLARVLAFPDWFGRNWDALEDCLTDLSWQEERGLVLVVEGFEVYAATDPAGFAILLDIFKSSAEYWRTEGSPFWVILAGPQSAGLELPVLLI